MISRSSARGCDSAPRSLGSGTPVGLKATTWDETHASPRTNRFFYYPRAGAPHGADDYQPLRVSHIPLTNERCGVGYDGGMAFNPDIHHRQSIRLPGFDYGAPGAYYVTMVTKHRERVFGDVVDGEMILNDVGRAAHACWSALPVHFPTAKLDEFVIMPNHMHGIIWIRSFGRGTACRAPTPERFGKPVSGSIPTMVRSFKSATTSRINAIRSTPGIPVWQRNYHEHVIRSEPELNRIRQYVIDNPRNWPTDAENKHPR